MWLGMTEGSTLATCTTARSSESSQLTILVRFAIGGSELLTTYRLEDEPLFLYMAFQNPHFPLQVPTSYVLKTACNSVPNRERRIYCGMVNALDNSVGKIVANLKEYGLW